MEGIPEKDMQERRRTLEQKSQGLYRNWFWKQSVRFFFHYNWICKLRIEIISCFFPESQKKKSNNQDDSDEDDDDDDEAGPSTQQMAAVQPQPGYGAPMAQLGMPPVAGTPGMHPGAYQGKKHSYLVIIVDITLNITWYGFSIRLQLTCCVVVFTHCSRNASDDAWCSSHDARHASRHARNAPRVRPCSPTDGLLWMVFVLILLCCFM